MTIPKSSYEDQVKELTESKSGGKLQIKSLLTGNSVYFPAFISSFSQTFTSNWNEEDVYGRMDSIATFQNTKRSISLSFDLPSANLQVGKENLQKCNTLAKFLYPGYIKQGDLKGGKSATGRAISRPPLVAVKYANLVSVSGAPQLGWLSGLEWSPDIEMGMFTDGKGNIYPKVIALSFTLNVLHQGERGFDESNEWIAGSSGNFFGGL